MIAEGGRRGLRILYVVEAFPSHIHPNQINPIEGAIRRGDEVVIATAERFGDTYPPIVDELDMIRRARYFPTERTGRILRGFLPYLSPIGQTGRSYRRGLRKALRSPYVRALPLKGKVKVAYRACLLSEPGFDLVHARFIPGASQYGFVAEVLGVPLLVTYGGMPPVGLPSLEQTMMQDVFARATLVVTNSRFSAQQLEALGCPPYKTRVLAQALPIDRFPFRAATPPRDGRLRLLTVARLSPEKGLEYAIDAVGMLRAEFPGIRYRIVGPGPARAQVQQHITERGLEDHITLVGAKSGDDVVAEYHAAHIHILPSITVRDGQGRILIAETQGVATQEAQSCGCLALLTDVGGMPEFVEHGKTAFVVPEGSARAIADQVRNIVRQPGRWASLLQSARTSVEKRFSAESIDQGLAALYREAILIRRTARTP